MMRRWVLISGLNWIGDSIMAMPALQAYRRQAEDASVLMLVKPGLIPLWQMHPGVDEIVALHGGLAGARRAAREVRSFSCQCAYIWPHSFRSAWVPFLAGVPERIGMPGHGRRWLLSRAKSPRGGEGREHQAYEYLDLMVDGSNAETIAAPQLRVGAEAAKEAADWLGDGATRWAGLMPGAARGPSKRWPAGHFVELGRRLDAQDGFRILVMGSEADRGLCEEIAGRIGPAAQSTAGKTPLPVWAGLLAGCAVCVANDSGGMHLAAALGTPVAALYGMTDPERTGPLGPARILRGSGEGRRDIPRHSDAARISLASIRPDWVYEAVSELLLHPPAPARQPTAGRTGPAH
jgi:heptosyltransferase-2